MSTGMHAVNRWIAPLKRRLTLMIGRSVLRLVDDAMQLQSLQVEALAGETLDGVERFQQYGFTSHPHPDAEAIILSVAGERANAVVIAVDDRRYRITNLTAGEVALYDDQGQSVIMKRDGIVIDTDRPDGVQITAPIVTVNAPVVTVDSADSVIVTAPVVTVDSADVRLGGQSGPAVARVGDMVSVSAGSSAGQWPIVSGSAKVTAA